MPVIAKQLKQVVHTVKNVQFVHTFECTQHCSLSALTKKNRKNEKWCQNY